MTAAGCARSRRELLRGVERVSGAAARHLDSCAECAVFAERFFAARDGLRNHRARLLPGPGFAARVTAALDAGGDGSEALSRAALRLLPATLALALALGAWCWLATSSPASLAGGSPGNDLLVWVLEDGG